MGTRDMAHSSITSLLPEGLATARLRLRPWGPARGIEGLERLLRPAVLAPLPPSLQERDPARWIAARRAEAEVLAIEADSALVGVALLAGRDPVHLGYLLAEEAWGKGFASEAVAGLLAALPGESFRAGVARDNPASGRVLVKAGFAVVGEAEGMVIHERVAGADP